MNKIIKKLEIIVKKIMKNGQNEENPISKPFAHFKVR